MVFRQFWPYLSEIVIYFDIRRLKFLENRNVYRITIFQMDIATFSF